MGPCADSALSIWWNKHAASAWFGDTGLGFEVLWLDLRRGFELRPCHDRHAMTVSLRNMSNQALRPRLLWLGAGDDVADLRCAPLDPLIGAFSLVNALRPLDPSGGQRRVMLAFNPPDCCEYQEILTLRWGPWRKFSHQSGHDSHCKLLTCTRHTHCAVPMLCVITLHRVSCALAVRAAQAVSMYAAGLSSHGRNRNIHTCWRHREAPRRSVRAQHE